jgi:hypothetical protein
MSFCLWVRRRLVVVRCNGMTKLFSRLLLLGLVLPFAARAQGSDSFAGRVLDGATRASDPSGLTTADSLEVVIGNVIAAALSLVGVLLVLIMIYAGFTWMTAGGSEEKIKTARSWIMNSIIGLVIVFAAYAIVRFVLLQLAGPVITDGGPV